VLAHMRLGLSSAVYRNTGDLSPLPPRSQLPVGARKAARKSNRYDAELYDYARELFEHAPELPELKFHCEIAAVRACMGAGGSPVTRPPASVFEGGDPEWRMLVNARAEGMRLEWELEDDEGTRLALVGSEPGSEADG
jgi:hypothetical protein